MKKKNRKETIPLGFGGLTLGKSWPQMMLPPDWNPGRTPSERILAPATCQEFRVKTQHCLSLRPPGWEWCPVSKGWPPSPGLERLTDS